MTTNIHEHHLRQKEIEEINTRPSVEEAELDIVMEALAESVVAASDEELLEDVRLQGKDPLNEAEEVRAVLLRAVSKQSAPRKVVTVTSHVPGRH
jgi:hypothetical protein